MKTLIIKLVMTLIFIPSYSFADTIMNNKNKAELTFQAMPKLGPSSIANTDLSTWGRCTYLYIFFLGEEAAGAELTPNIAFMLAAMGESLKRVKANFLSRGYSSENLDDIFKTYASKGKLTSEDINFCTNIWFAKVFNDSK